MANKNSDTFDGGQYGTLRYDFKSWGGVQGIIPDPSDKMIEDYMKGLRDAAKEFGAEDADTDNMSAAEVQELMEDDKNMEIEAAQAKIAELTSELCQGSPNTPQLLALPFRVRQGFLKWLQGKLMDPEANAAGTTDSRVRRIGG